MAPTTISLIVFAYVFGGSLFGMYLGVALGEDQLNTDSRDLLKLGMGLMGIILELHSPLTGLIRIPSEPLRYAIAHLGQ